MDAALERFVWSCATFLCEYCHLPRGLDALPFCIDHIIAQKHHGPSTEDNL